MTLKKILTIDTDDSSFKAFKANFDKYEAALKKMPAAWASVGKENKAAGSQFERMAGALTAQVELSRKVAAAEKETARTAKSIASSWSSVATSTKSVLGNVSEISRHLLKWSALGGLLGAGGLWGLDKLGETVSRNRRSATGLGMSYGEQSAFGLDFGRYVNPNSFLGGVSAARADPNLTGPFSALGMTSADLQGDTAQVGVRFLDRLRQFAKRTPSNMLGAYADNLGLGQFGIGAEDLRRLRDSNDEEYDKQRQAYTSDAGQLGLGSDTQRKWQNLTTQLDRAGLEIETVLVKGLTPLAKPLGQLSQAFEQAVAELLNGPVKQWIPELASGIKSAADELSSPKFQNAVKTFVDDLDTLAVKIAGAIKWLGGDSAATAAGNAATVGAFAGAGGALGGLPGAAAGGALGAGIVGVGNALGRNAQSSGFMVDPWSGAIIPLGNNNPLNLRVPGSSAFQSFPNVGAGYAAAARQLKRYQDVYHLNTIAGIENRWEPPGDGNDTALHIKQIAAQTGYGPNQHLDLHNMGTLTTLLAAKAQVESGIKTTPAHVRVLIQNNTGGNAVVSANQLPQ